MFKSQKNRLHVEQLETRQMMAGDVLAFMSSGNLNVVEAVGEYGQGQAVQISQLSNGQIRVKGLSSQDGGTSLINGAAYKDFTVPGNLIVNLAGGRDTVLLGRSSPTTFNNVMVNTGDGLDAIYVEGVTTRQNLTINSGASPDYINVFDTKVGDGYGIDNLSIDSGAGADTINVLGISRPVEVTGNLSIYTFNSTSELDADRVVMQTAFARDNLQAFTGSGDDYLEVVNGYAGNDVLFSTDAGNDKMKLQEVRAVDDFWAMLGDGNDTLDATYLRADVLSLNGGAGYDSLSKSVNGPVNQLVQTNWEVINGVRQWNFYVNKLNNVTLIKAV
jgi:hypothetical protein